jgi:putative colanic acid biosynthesis UDP-glucose lipid carrier transferase
MKRLIQQTFDLFHTVIILVFDTLVLYGCFWLGYQLWSISPIRHRPSIPEFVPSHIVLYVLLIEAVLIWGGTHQRQTSVSHVVRLKDIIKYCLIGFAGSILASFFTRFLQVGRMQVFLTFLIMIPCITLERVIVDKLWTRLIVRKFLQKKILIYGAGNTGKRLAKSIAKYPKMGYRAVGFFDDQKSTKSVIMANPLPVFGGREKFIEYLKRKRKAIDEVHIAMPAANTNEIKRVMNICQQYNVPFKFVPNLNDLMLHRVVQEQIDGIPLFSIGELYISLLNRLVKRIFPFSF